MEKVKNILLIVNSEKNIPENFLFSLNDLLMRNECEIFVFPETEKYLKKGTAKFICKTIEHSSALSHIDMAIVLGGDGSILRAAGELCTHDIKILGINFGTLGYMAELEATDVTLLEQVLKGNYIVEERMMLKTSIIREDGSEIAMPEALNDIVLSNGPIARLLNFNVTCDGVLIKKSRADGMVIATPTGSTAYSMSAGGPVLSPCLNAFCLTPICPHSFSNRPVILPGESTVVLSDIVAKENSVYVTVDGRLAEKLYSGDVIKVSRSDFTTKLIRLQNNSFLSVLSSKLQEV